MAATLRAAILPYKSGFVASDLATVKLKQEFQGGRTKDKKCPVFSGEHGIEALLYVEERFRKISTRTLQWTTGLELFDGFEEVLVDTALSNWEDLILPLAEADKTAARFEIVLQLLYRKYVSAEARDIQFEYFRTLRKPLKSSPLEHSSRMLTLARYGNKLPGNEPVLNDEQVKKCIFQSYPTKWQQQFIRSGQRVATSTLSDIVEFMNNEKIFADSQDTSKTTDKKKASNSFKDSRSDSSKKRKTYNEKRAAHANKKGKITEGLKPDSECPIHGGHPWVKCFDNPTGENYKPRGSDGRRPSPGGRGRGRGGYPSAGRGNGGRGNGAGRGNGQYSFQAEKPAAESAQATPVQGFQGNPEQHHFDQIGKDPNWGWDADDQQPGE
jgi:hypothetical protein